MFVAYNKLYVCVLCIMLCILYVNALLYIYIVYTNTYYMVLVSIYKYQELPDVFICLWYLRFIIFFLNNSNSCTVIQLYVKEMISKLFSFFKKPIAFGNARYNNIIIQLTGQP